MSIRKGILALWLAVALLPVVAQAQKNINTVVGGGPNGLAPASSSIGIPVGVAQDSAGNLYISDTNSNRVYILTASTGLITVFAGTGGQGYTGDTKVATAAQLSGPTGLFVDGTGNVFIADSGNNVIREVAVTTNIITTVAGTGVPGFTGDGGAATSATLNNPNGVYVDAAGDIFIADSGNNAVREVVAGTTPTIMRIAGSAAGTPGFTGDNGPATSATLNNPLGVTLDTAGNIFIADHNNNAIREVLKSDSKIHTYAGSPTGAFGASGDNGLATAALLHGPSAVFEDTNNNNNNLYIVDSSNHEIREVTVINGKIQTVAGNGTQGLSGDGGPARFAQLSLPRGVFVDATGNIVIADTGNHLVRQVVAANTNIHILAGNGQLSFSGDGGLALGASLNTPAGVAVDGSGNIFIADTLNNVIREVVASTGLIRTFAGQIGAVLNSPAGVFVDNFGNVFIADTKNHVIREVLASNGSVQTIAGTVGTSGFSGDSALAISAKLNSPSAVFVDANGNVFIADTGNNAVREVTAADLKIQTVAGNGTLPAGFGGDGGLATSAQLSAPADVFLDAFGNIFIADTGNHVVREVTIADHKIQTFAGNHALGAGYSGDNGSPTSAQLNGPKGVIMDASGDVFIADTGNNVIREIDVASGKIQTVAGNHTAGFTGDGGLAVNASMNSPIGMALDNLGGIDIADAGNNRIRDVNSLFAVPKAGVAPTSLNFNNQVIGRTSPSQPVVLTNTGTAPMGFVGVTFTGPNFNSFAQTNACPSTLAPNATCTINVTFTPQAGGALSANMVITDSAPGSPQTVAVSGTGVSAVVLSPTGLSFPLQINGTSGTPQSITVTNNQTVALGITSIAITGTNNGSFSQVNTCGVTVASAASCTITVTFTPNFTGSNSANLVITDDAPGGQQSATLFGLGTGATATLSPKSVTFTTQKASSTSTAQVVTLTNNGKETLNISSIGFGGTNPGDYAQTTTCGPQVLPAANCTISVTFTPIIGGPSSATLLVNDSAGDSPQSITLSGTGLDFQVVLASGTSSTATVTAGGTAQYTIQVDAVGGSVSTDSIAVALSCGGSVPTGVTCTVGGNSVTVNPSTSAQVSVTLATTARTALTPPRAWPIAGKPLVTIYILVILALLTWILGKQAGATGFRRRLSGVLAVTLLLVSLGCSVAVLSGCGSGVPPTVIKGTAGPTPAGTYTISITGTVGTDVHTLILTLVVQ